jgi:hypothetical protein
MVAVESLAVPSQPIPIAPRFSLRQMLFSVVWMALGMGEISLAIRPYEVPPGRTYDWIADCLGVARVAGIVVGWTFVCVGIITLVATRRRMLLLIWALLGIIPGGILGILVRQAWRPAGSALQDAIVPIGMALGSITLLTIAFYLVRSSDKLSGRAET